MQKDDRQFLFLFEILLSFFVAVLCTNEKYLIYSFVERM